MIALIGSPDPLAYHVAQALRAAGRAPLLCRLVDREKPEDDSPDVIRFRLEHLGTFLDRLAGMGVTEVCLVGKVARPRIDAAEIDAATMPLVPRMIAALRRGDDGALREVLAILEDRGFAVRAAHELAPALLPPPCVLSRVQPSPTQMADARRAEEIHRLVAPADIGQGVILRDGWVIAVEAGPGTDHMLRSVQGLADRALFLKGPKLGQDRRADLPVIGPMTIERAVEARLGAVVVEAGGVMVLQRDKCVELADAAGLVLWVREPGA